MKYIALVVSCILISSYAYAAESRAPSQSITTASALNAHQEEVINQLMTVTGLQSYLRKLPEQIIVGARQARARLDTQGEEGKAIEQILIESFPADGFLNRATDTLRKNYNEKRYLHMVQVQSAPLPKRMTELESIQPSSEDLQEFRKNLTDHPLLSRRIHLLNRLDAATQSSVILAKIAMTAYQLNLLAVADDCGRNTPEIDKYIDKIRPLVRQSSQKSIQAMFAYTYRDVSDAELNAYIKIYESKDARWMQGLVNTSIEEEFEADVTKEAQEIRRLIDSKKPKQTMFAPKCPGISKG